MAWIESHQSLRNHKKLLRLESLLRVGQAKLIGHLHLLWWWALDNAPDGNLTALNSKMIAKASEWRSSPDRFVNALVDAGFLDRTNESLILHDWYDYAGKLIDRRREKRDAMRKLRETRTKEGQDVTTTLQPSYGNVTTYPTQPNHTVSIYTRSFDELFWPSYPRKQAKQDALKAWEKLKPDDTLTNVILSALEKQKSTVEWQKNDGEFIPFAASWIKGRRWEDQIEQSRKNPMEFE